MVESAPKAMSWDEYLITDEPVDGTVLEWWETRTRLDVRLWRATYSINTSWEDHRWSKGGDRRGQPFVHDWAIEEYSSPNMDGNYRWCPDSRAVGWDGLRGLVSEEPAMSGVWTDRAEALQHKLKQLIRSKERLARELEETSEAIKFIEGELEKIDA